MTEQEFNSVMMPYEGALKGYALKLMRDEDDAADLVQDALVKAWRFRERFVPGSNAKAWLHRILERCMMDMVRRIQVRPQTVELEVGVHDPVLEPAVSIGDELASMVRGLSAKKRAVLLLRVQGYNDYEIACLLDMAVTYVPQVMHRIRRRVRV